MSSQMDYAAQDREKSEKATVDNESVSSVTDDDRVLQEIGYVPSFKREFSNLATVSTLPSARRRLLSSHGHR